MIYKSLKRFSDILIAAIALVVFIPILVPVAILLLVTGEHKVFYFQERIGYKNKSFRMYKFATMLKDSPGLGTRDVTLKDDFRVLPFGKILRKTKINELPQIINVLIGDMSIVGARPLMPESFETYTKDVQKVIYATRPGITGVGSIFFRDEEEIIDKSNRPPREFYNNVIIPYKGNLEIWYQNNKSMSLDIKVIFLTAWSILFPKTELINKVLADLPKFNNSI